MSGLIYYTDKRRIIPQIESSDSFKETINVTEIVGNKHQNTEDLISPVFNLNDENIALKIEEWNKTQSISLAGDILSQAIVSGNKDDYENIKKFLLEKTKDDEILNWLYNDKNKYKGDTLEDRIAINHRMLKHEPLDSITWTDQAVNFIQINNRDEALNAIETAIKINKDLGFIVRNAARIFGLTGDNGRAIKTLKSSQYYKNDPQIVSAEIAYSQLENRRTNGLDFGNKLITDKKYNEREKSELASALGTYEMTQGDKKRAEKLFDISMISPNKNSLAQFVWYKKEEIDLNKLPKSILSNEIKTHIDFKHSNFDASLKNAKHWISEEPYSLRPYMVASHLSGVLLGDFESAFKIMEQANISQKEIKGEHYSKKDEIIFGNDLAYCLLKMNQVNEAENYLSPLVELNKLTTKLEDFQSVGIATLGLYAYKIGDYELGRKFYRKAIKNFQDEDKVYLAGSAFINYLEEELEVVTDSNDLYKLLNELEDIIPNETENDLLFIKKRVLSKFQSKLASR